MILGGVFSDPTIPYSTLHNYLGCLRVPYGTLDNYVGYLRVSYNTLDKIKKPYETLHKTRTSLLHPISPPYILILHNNPYIVTLRYPKSQHYIPTLHNNPTL